MSEEDIVHENANYVVEVGDFPEPMTYHGGGQYVHGYIVRNKATNVEEVYTPQLPDAIMASEQLDMAVEQRAWDWLRAEHSARIESKEPSKPEEVH